MNFLMEHGEQAFNIFRDWGWLLGIVWLGWLVGRKERPKPKTTTSGSGAFSYSNQDEMRVAGLGYDDVLSDPGVEKVKIAVMVGGRLAEMDDSLLRRLDKLTLSQPDSAFLEYLFELRGSSTKLGGAKRRIHGAIQKCLENEKPIEVACHPFLAFQCLIAYRCDGGSWARWETILPAKTPDSWPTHVVKKAENQELFNRVVETFEKQHAYAINWNSRDLDDGARVIRAIRQSEGKRLRYEEPLGA